MKKLVMLSMMLFACFAIVNAQQKPQIKLDKITHDFDRFSESTPKQKCVFTFTSVGNAPLIINQAVANCGCTVSAYTETPVQPGKKGEIRVAYNGKGRFPGRFKKTTTIHINGEPGMTRLYIKGVMEEAEK